jgi:HEAT repeat protein
LQGYIRSHDVATRLAAIDGLGSLGPTPSSLDGPLLALLRDPLPEVRLHAADAVAATGGAHARDALLEALKTGAELDRVSALHALRGVLLRAPADTAWHQLAAALEVAAGGERDALLLVLGRTAPVHPYVEALVASSDADDRRTALSACAGRPEAVQLERAGLSDPDPTVRAEAAWGLASSAGRELVPQLEQVVRSATPAALDSAVNAAGAIARVAGRTHESEAIAALCHLLGDPRSLVRANALVGLSLAGARCGAGDVERSLVTDTSPAVRAAAARALGAHRSREDDVALAHCGATDRSAEVAELCRTSSVAHPPRNATRVTTPETVVYVEGLRTTAPLAKATFRVELGDGVIRAGTADRRGAFFEPNTPAGLLRLLAPEPGP